MCVRIRLLFITRKNQSADCLWPHFVKTRGWCICPNCAECAYMCDFVLFFYTTLVNLELEVCIRVLMCMCVCCNDVHDHVCVSVCLRVCVCVCVILRTECQVASFFSQSGIKGLQRKGNESHTKQHAAPSSKWECVSFPSHLCAWMCALRRKAKRGRYKQTVPHHDTFYIGKHYIEQQYVTLLVFAILWYSIWSRITTLFFYASAHQSSCCLHLPPSRFI